MAFNRPKNGLKYFKLCLPIDNQINDRVNLMIYQPEKIDHRHCNRGSREKPLGPVPHNIENQAIDGYGQSLHENTELFYI